VLVHALVMAQSIVRAILQLKELKMESFAMVPPPRLLHAIHPKLNRLRKVADLRALSEWTVS